MSDPGPSGPSCLFILIIDLININLIFKQHTRTHQNYIPHIGILPQFDKKYGQVDIGHVGITKWKVTIITISFTSLRMLFLYILCYTFILELYIIYKKHINVYLTNITHIKQKRCYAELQFYLREQKQYKNNCYHHIWPSGVLKWHCWLCTTLYNVAAFSIYIVYIV